MYSKGISKSLFRKILTLSLFGIFVAAPVHAGLVIIVHPDNNSDINEASVKKIFLGKTKSFLNGQKAVPIDLESGPVRSEFIENILRKDEGSLASYWSRMLFSGKAAPPKSFKTMDEIKAQVAQNPNLIGFIDSEMVDASVKVVDLK